MKNKTRKFVMIVVALLLIVLIQAIGVTYAKYIVSDKMTGEAEVAKWAFQIKNEGEEAKNIKLIDTANIKTFVDGKIAPGSSGVIYIVFDGTGSEVDLDYHLKFYNEKNKPTNLYFTYRGEQYSSLSEIENITGSFKYNDVTKQNRIAILWNWKYETGSSNDEKNKNDIIDTEDASKITQYTFDAVVTATQSN